MIPSDPDPAVDLDHLRQWLDKSETRHDSINPAMAAALATTLEGPRQPQSGDALPPLWHWIYFWNACPQSEVGPDGHPQRGGFLPPVPLPRRMWAGGRLRFDAPLPIGSRAEKHSRIASVEIKQGRSGALAFVTVHHTISHAGRLCLTEEHDIVYRDLPRPGAAVVLPASAPEQPRWTRRIEPDPVLLFRYSALTFNGHRIHYDRSYVTGVEGYPGLIVHGPLIATLLADLLAREMPQAVLREFSFRALGTLFDIAPFTLCGKPSDDGRRVALWAQNERGQLAMQAEAVLA